ncbi:hypothetical protein ABXV22_18995 [Vibrio rotiferianus]|uniref:hypothetical protein n=1 Tax=Vibrio rotiferianus TaxID=190895 RepID=UPI0033934E74
MESQFVKNITLALAKSFFYCPENGAPSIQVGKELGDFIFWLKYSEEAINRCASTLIKELGNDLGISEIQSSKRLLLDFSSFAFNTLDADFFAINMTDLCVDDILSDQHRSNLCFMFDEYVSAKKKKYPYMYTLQYAKLNGVIRLNDDISLYGFGEVDHLIEDIKTITGFNISRNLLDEEDIRNEPICRYARFSNRSLVLVYARSKVEAVESLDRLFGALCLTINAPFRINQLSIDDRINSFNRNSLHTEHIRVNLPSVYELDINDIAIAKLKEIFCEPSKRMNSALSFVAHGWTHDKRERFLNHFIALDALYGTVKDNKQAITKGVSRDATAIENISSKIRTIYDLRSKFVHGEISSFSGHGKYLSFVDAHGTDPLNSLFEILVECVLNYDGLYRKRASQ